MKKVFKIFSWRLQQDEFEVIWYWRCDTEKCCLQHALIRSDTGKSHLQHALIRSDTEKSHLQHTLIRIFYEIVTDYPPDTGSNRLVDSDRI